MAKGDDIITNAIDAAEAQIASAHDEANIETESNTQGDGAPQASESKPEEVEAAPSKPQTRGRTRDGKFVKSALEAAPANDDQIPSDQKAEVGTAEAEKGEGLQATPDVAPPIELPTFWSAELKQAVAKAQTPEAKTIARLAAADAAQRIEWADRIARESESDRAFRKEVYDGWETRQAAAALNGVNNPLEELRRYRAWDEVFRGDIRGGMRTLLKNNGLTPYDLVEDENQSPETFEDPRVGDMQTRLDEQQKFIDEQKAWRENQERTSLDAELETFKNGTDEAGRTRRAFVQSFEHDIAHVIGLIRKEEQTRGLNPLSRSAALKTAYDIVIDAKEQEGVISKPQKAKAAPTTEAVIAHAEKARAIAGSVTGGPSGGLMKLRPRVQGKTEKEQLNNAVNMADEMVNGAR